MEQNKKEMLMTSGPIYKQIIIFTIPLLLGNVFQQLYNTVDSIIVGRFVDSDALAAVGSSGPVIGLIVGLLMGIGVGGGVVIAQYYGAKDVDKLKASVHTTTAFGLIGGILFSVFGVVFTPTLLRWMGTPESVFENSALYLRIIFAGVLFQVMYNMGSGILRGAGLSKVPMFIMTFCWCGLRLIWIAFALPLWRNIRMVFWAYPITWTIGAVVFIWYFLKVDWMHKYE